MNCKNCGTRGTLWILIMSRHGGKSETLVCWNLWVSLRLGIPACDCSGVPGHRKRRNLLKHDGFLKINETQKLAKHVVSLKSMKRENCKKDVFSYFIKFWKLTVYNLIILKIPLRTWVTFSPWNFRKFKVQSTPATTCELNGTECSAAFGTQWATQCNFDLALHRDSQNRENIKQIWFCKIGEKWWLRQNQWNVKSWKAKDFAK